jgi:CubicO group peptidase (beta-lactamase class C family)
LQTQQPDQVEQKQQSVPQKCRDWRRLILIAHVVVIVGLLAPLAFPHSSRGQMFYRAHYLLSALSKQIITEQAQSLPVVPRELDAAERPQSIADQIDNLLHRQVNNQQFSGSVLVAQRGQILLARGYSMANWNSQIPNTAETRFYLGSVTKEFTAMAILILQGQGKLHVQDPLCYYIAHCPAPWQPLSIKEVLTHTSGIPQLDDSQLSGVSPAAWIASFNNVPLQFTPGGEFQYCSTCYQILAYVVQQVSGVPYTQFVQQMILDPLQMKDSGFDANAYYFQPNSATGYISWKVRAEQIGVQLSPQWSFLDGSGLLYSTVEDLYRWDQALYTSALVPQQTLDQAFTPYVTANLFPGSQYGYGWFISQSPISGHRLFWHDGVVDGFRNYIGRYVDDDVTIVFLGNLSTIDIVSLAHTIEQIIFGGASTT